MKSLEEVFRRYEFNKTEPETLVSLVENAVKTGDELKDELKRFREITEKLLKVLDHRKFVVSTDPKNLEDIDKYQNMQSAGIDGSLQPIEGFGGYWFVPTSCATVLFEHGPYSHAEVRVSASIEKIKEHEYFGVGTEATSRMMIAETKAIMDYAERTEEPALLFIDGPIIDPPSFAEEKYVKYRCLALSKCLKKKILVIGCVKRMKARFLIEFMENNLLTNDIDRKLISNYAWDSHLITAVFTKLNMITPKRVLTTIPLDISKTDVAHEAYRKCGIIVYSMYLQIDDLSRPLRLDFPIIPDTEESVLEQASKILKACFAWYYPGFFVPLPVFLAHKKCEVRKGCADVLYGEIITRSKSADPFENLMNEKLKR